MVSSASKITINYVLFIHIDFDSEENNTVPSPENDNLDNSIDQSSIHTKRLNEKETNMRTK